MFTLNHHKDTIKMWNIPSNHSQHKIGGTMTDIIGNKSERVK